MCYVFGISTTTINNKSPQLVPHLLREIKKYDVVIGDVFNDLSTPYHLTTLEFNELVKANMTEDGIYLINITPVRFLSV